MPLARRRRHGTNADDLRIFPRDAGKVLASQESALEIDIHGEVIILHGHFRDLRGNGQARQVQKRVCAAKGFADFRKESGHLALIRDIEHASERILRQIFEQRLHGRRIVAGEGQQRSLLREAAA